MNNIGKIRRHRHNRIGRDNLTRQSKPMCVVTFRIPFFKDSYFQAFDYVILEFVKLILRKAGNQHST